MKKDKKKDILLEEHLRKIKYRVGYKINESPKYRPLISTNEEFDDIPTLTNEAGQEDAPKPEGQEPPQSSNDQSIGTKTPVPAFDKGGDVPPESDSIVGVPPVPEQQVDDIQNEIIKHNIEAMKSIHDQLQSLEDCVKGLNAQLEKLGSDVEEVREPTNSEKLMNKAAVSYPYYFNLNDFWSGNWFNERREMAKDGGIKQLPDGSFVADFDELPQKSNTDIQNSFNEISESIDKKDVKLKEELNISNQSQTSQIDGKSKVTAIRYIYNKISPYIKGFFSDNSWENVYKIFKMFDEMGLNWSITKTEYGREMPPKYKVWYFEIDFIGDNGRQKKILGNLIAAGAGSVKNPLDKYDITVVLN